MNRVRSQGYGVFPDRPFQREGLVHRLAPFLVTLPIVFGWGFASNLDKEWLTGAAVLAAALVAMALSIPWGLFPRWADAVIPLMAFAIVGMVNIAANSNSSAFATLVMMPVLWIALYHSRLESILGIAATAITFLVPLAISSLKVDVLETIRFASIWTVIVAAVTLITQSLVHRLQEGTLHMKRLTDSANEAFIAMDQNGIITDWNPTAERTFGYTREEVIGRTVAETIIPTQLREKHRLGLERFVRTGVSHILNQRMELTAVHRTGLEFPVELTISPSTSGDSVTFFAFLHDISERKHAEEQQRIYAKKLERVNRELLAADEMKGQFVAMASHELRTPLTAISGFSSTMLNMWETLPDEQKREFVSIIDIQASRLSRLAEDLLTLSRIENGKVTARPTLVDLYQLTERVALEFKQKEVKVECTTNTHAFADEHHVEQILVNFVDNALKYGSQPIRIEVEADNLWVKLFVKDSGSGVPEDFIPRLFERFSRAGQHSQDGGPRGSGLGLSIVRGLAQAQGGDVWYEPNQPTGSCFGVFLPTTERES